MSKTIFPVVMIMCMLSFVSGLALLDRPAEAQDIIAKWNSVRIPHAPEVKDFKVDPKTTSPPFCCLILISRHAMLNAGHVVLHQYPR